MPKHKKEFASRFSASLPPELMRLLDKMVREKGYDNRSQAIADMIRDKLVEHRQQSGDGEIAGSITLVYDHHQRLLQEHLTDIQHDHGENILATMHCHLDHHNCLELIAVRGAQSSVKKIADALIGARGVKHGKLVITSTGHDLPA
jgi:CopG family nickel-responsive transcriptional regulator